MILRPGKYLSTTSLCQNESIASIFLELYLVVYWRIVASEYAFKPSHYDTE
jgi:hypothetical protein